MLMNAKRAAEIIGQYYFPLAIFYMEMVVKIFCFGTLSLRSAIYTGLFSISVGMMFALLSGLGKRKGNLLVGGVLMGITFLFCAAQVVYFSIFETFGTLYSLFVGGAEAVTGFWDSALEGILASAVPLLFLALPFVLFLIYGRKSVPDGRLGRNVLLRLAGGSVAAYLLAVLLILTNNSGVMPVKYLYSEAFVPVLSVDEFGVITTLRLDAKNLLLGGVMAHSKDPDSPAEDPEEPDDSPPPPPEYGYNVTEIDFDALIAGETDEVVKDMHRYFSAVQPTKKNEYTGLFKGKNLIWIVGEAFSTLALNEKTSPTLSRLAREGFVFNNFYNPVWSVSTSDGEYVTMTGLLPKSGVWSFQESAKNQMAFCFGNLLSPLGYTTKAYHNHYYSYYGRNLSHPNMGYEYKGLGNGLKVTETWPESDLEMMQLTLPNDMQSTPFHTYYMTVSGHLNYTFYGNRMASNHKDLVDGLDYSEGSKAYLAANAELDLGVEYILEQLSAAGQLENTVIAISGDHYPYGLTDEQMDELAGYPLEKRFEKYKSTLILWSGSMEKPVYVDKVCSSLDVLPTLANLLGVEYDSRLIMGQDILSDSPGLVEFNDRSFLTDFGRYDSKTNEFKPFEGETAEEDYAKKVFSQVNNEFAYSAKILDKDYYRKVFQ